MTLSQRPCLEETTLPIIQGSHKTIISAVAKLEKVSQPPLIVVHLGYKSKSRTSSGRKTYYMYQLKALGRNSFAYVKTNP